MRTRLGFLRTALAAAVALPLFASSAAFAQDAAAKRLGARLDASAATGAAPQPGSESPTNASGGGAEVERIIVTGSNIPTAEEVGPNPVLNISRDLINKSGERTAEGLIKNLPVANGGGVPVSNNATGSTPGASAISLRGLGPEATLVLIDGRRLAPFPVGNNGTSSFFDLRSIPEAAIESIEILKDGASTTYGADAVAGVVNIKLRHDYKGVEASIEYGNTTDKDSGEYRASLVFGVGDGTTQVTGTANYYHRNSIFARDRGYSAVPPFLSGNSTPYNIQISYDAFVAAGGAPPPGFGPVGNPAGLPSLFNVHAPVGSSGFAPASAYVVGDQTFNFNRFAGAFPELENYGGFVNFSHKIFGDQMVLFGDLFYENSKTHTELAPGATGAFNTPGSVVLSIPPNNPGPELGVLPDGTGAPSRTDVGEPPGSYNPFNPFQQVISGDTAARLIEFGNRLYDDESDNFLTTIGVKGDKLFDGTWGYDGGFRYNRIKITSIGRQTSASRFNRILNQADPIFQPGGVLAGQPAFNPFGDGLDGTPIPGNQAAVDYAVVSPKDVSTSEVATLDLNIYTTSLFKLPAGGVGFAFGGQFRREQLTQTNDQINIEGDIPGNSPAASTNAGRKDFAFYGETNIPIFSPVFSFPGFHSLELSAAVRYEEFRNNNTNVAVPKFGLRWQPIDESLTVRATIGEGFREPSLIELFASPTTNLVGVQDILPGPNDPVNLGGPVAPVRLPDDTLNPARFDPEQSVVVTSTPTLQPEDSRSFSAGIVWTPKFVNGLTLSIDIWDIERTGVVVQSQIGDVLQRELAGKTGTGQGLLPGEIVQRDNAGNLQRVFTPFINSGSLKANGIDFGLQYVYPTAFGTFSSLTNVTWLNSFQFAGAPGGSEKERAGTATDPFAADDAYLKWRGVHRLDWTWHGFDIIGTLNYTGGFHDRKSEGAIHYVSQTWTVDGQASYDFTFVAPPENQPVAGYAKDARDVTTGQDGKATESDAAQASTGALPIWQRLLNRTTLTLGCDNIFGQDPPKAYGFGGNGNGYPGFLYDSTGRFVYVQLTKKF